MAEAGALEGQEEGERQVARGCGRGGAALQFLSPKVQSILSERPKRD